MFSSPCSFTPPVISAETANVTLYYGVDGKTDTSKVRVGNEYTLPNVSLKVEGRKFSGWEDSDGNVYMAGTDVLISADTFFTAVWTAETTTTLIGGIEYADPVTAFRSLKDGETIEILSDVESSGLMYTTENGVSPFPDEGITLDFNGNTLTCIGPAVGSSGTESQILHFEKDSKVTIKDAVIVNNTSSVGFMLQNYAYTTLDNVEFIPDENVTLVFSNNNGRLVLKNGTHIHATTNTAYSYVGDACFWKPYYPNGTSMIIEDDSVVIEGTVCIDYSVADAEDIAAGKLVIVKPIGYDLNYMVSLPEELSSYEYGWIPSTVAGYTDGYEMLFVGPSIE